MKETQHKIKHYIIGYDIKATNNTTEMSYCIYNKEFDQFLSLVSNNKHGFVNHQIKWDDEFNYAFAGLDKINKADESVHISTVWPMELNDGSRGNFFALIYRLIYGQYSEKNHMEDIRFVPITDGVPDFENESAFK